MENLESENRPAILEILDRLRERAARNEVLQVLVVFEDAGGEFDCQWCGSADRFAISGFTIGCALTRMGFTRTPEQS